MYLKHTFIFIISLENLTDACYLIIEGKKVETLKLSYQYVQFTVQVAVKWYHSNIYIHNAFMFSWANSVCNKFCLCLHKVCHVR